MHRYPDWTEIRTSREVLRFDAYRVWDCDHPDYVKNPVKLNFKSVYPYVLEYTDGVHVLCFTDPKANTGFWEVEVEDLDQAEEILQGFPPGFDLAFANRVPLLGYH